MTTARPAAVIVLAAGEGTRMRSATPKVLHTLGGRSMLGHALAAARALDPHRVAVVVRHEREAVAAHALEVDPGVVVADQDEIPGTGRAVQCGLGVLDAAAQAERARRHSEDGGDGPVEARLEGPVVVLAGDIPLLDGPTLAELLEAHVSDGNVVTVLTTELEDATGYGRVVRDATTGEVSEIVEHRDATDDQRRIREINSSVYVFDAAVLRDALGRLGQDNAQGEVYLTDVVAIARRDGGSVRALRVDDPVLVEGVNDRAQMSVLRAELNRRVLQEWMLEGVTVVDPATTWVDVDVRLERDVTLLPGTQLYGRTHVASGAVVGPDTTLTDVEVGVGAQVVRSHGSGAKVGAGAVVGPFSYLRPGTDLGADGKIGAFVETKNARIGTGSKVPHLSYVGDATIGEQSNVGAGTIFVNYDGVAKHHTSVGAHVRIGSQNALVAPVTLGDGAYTGAGSVIRRDVGPGALGINTAPQRTLDRWVLRRRPQSPSARAAAVALGEDDDGPEALSPQARAELARGADGNGEGQEGQR
ncbi:bifunctional UDP-N-acetylglucosamine diphosphorylase/glucosamine-1-phosphate N-acetyltransferase GlmU [Cellulomonas bogoriensis]|uniref:Bifunctional protein GlmU n=1 Tax=Cellulomonas bogoriensis 69B4 = DSM 16987 TaxID=1386082 RepID=A0A0A0C3J4_9CELL|nr:bifunctional UDP-N-acetylglucosamine diphosphorylase/glucosamine-1-phosphate N-acetyltransferase GlmU [Cellulomonas bogoriensis]KGM13954.1 bifunctional N-acetylglucosamine-1-phosphate uridyltransferase/glucosamine-1-phosphate acetyltransferase [Cellulomonas bogoriensis 69B4 = DSM 16987]